MIAKDPGDMTHQQLADYLELIDHDMFNNDLPYYAEAIKRLREYYEPDPPRDCAYV